MAEEIDHDFSVFPKEVQDQGDEALTLAKSLHPFFKGREPGVAGAALGDVVATWLSGHHPKVRDAILHDWLTMVLKIVQATDKYRELTGKTYHRDPAP